jgi:predicted AAA+ superfamily ATPase
MDESHFIPRHVTDEVIDAPTETRIVASRGPRQSGKSTLARSRTHTIAGGGVLLDLRDDLPERCGR